MKRFIVISILFCFSMACSSSKTENGNSRNKVFLELVLGSTKKEAMSQINSLIKSDRIHKSQSNELKGFFEYPFFVNGWEYNSYFVLHFNDKDELLESITIEIQDPNREIHIGNICKLLAKKYGNPKDSSTSYYKFNLKDPFKAFTWYFKEKKGVVISAARTYLSSFGNTSDNTNFYKIEYQDMDIFFDDWRERMINEDNKNEEGQKRIEKDL